MKSMKIINRGIWRWGKYHHASRVWKEHPLFLTSFFWFSCFCTLVTHEVKCKKFYWGHIAANFPTFLSIYTVRIHLQWLSFNRLTLGDTHKRQFMCWENIRSYSMYGHILYCQNCSKSEQVETQQHLRSVKCSTTYNWDVENSDKVQIFMDGMVKRTKQK